VTQTVTPGANDEVRFSYAGDVGVAPVSVTRPLLVRRLVSLTVPSSTATVGDALLLTGRATPVAAHVRVVAQQLAAGSWHVVARTTTGRHGWYRCVVTPTTRGPSTYRVVIAATPRLASGVSSIVDVTAA